MKKNFQNQKKIVRPRSSDLSKKVLVDGKICYVWCTFGHDQVDFDFRNPNVLIYFLEIIKFYLDQDIKALRLDVSSIFCGKNLALGVLTFRKLII